MGPFFDAGGCRNREPVREHGRMFERQSRKAQEGLGFDKWGERFRKPFSPEGNTIMGRKRRVHQNCSIEKVLKDFHEVVHRAIDARDAGLVGEALALLEEFDAILLKHPRRTNGAIAIALARLVRLCCESTAHGGMLAQQIRELREQGIQLPPVDAPVN